MESETKVLHSFLWYATGISRIGLNIYCFIGTFTLGIPLIDLFKRLNNQSIGLMYWFSYVILSAIVFVKRFGDLNLELKDIQLMRLLAFIGLIIYLTAWVHSNIILSKYRRFGKSRLDELDKLPQDQLTMNLLVEKGLIKLKVLSLKDEAFEEFRRALQFSGGSDNALTMVADYTYHFKQYNLAKQFYERALSNTGNNTLIKHINKVLPYVEKKLKKSN